MSTADRTSATVRGTLQPDGTIRLDEPPGLPPGPLLVTLQALPRAVPAGSDATQGRPSGPTGLRELTRELRRMQQAVGHTPRTAEEIDAEVRELREEWEERQRQIEAIQDEAERLRASRAGAGSASEGRPPC